MILMVCFVFRQIWFRDYKKNKGEGTILCLVTFGIQEK